ncbi:MAG TPA: choice-of-anchor tandem repeat GloVer-containing protein [Candidatus Sulfotelmatobacter sp.]|nr:choice-of-anchor tandem repeat GloVer-containing protein [Candidatus Sulfotelmatobacter sp.]
MYRTRSWMKTAVIIAAACVLLAVDLLAATETVLHSFKSKEGASPLLGLIFDSSGNLYGVAAQEGLSRCGSVFELTVNGTLYTENTLYFFKGGSDGCTPVAGLVFDKSGNLYGTTKLGGSHTVGTAYKLTKSGSMWSESVIHNFGGTNDGQYPTGSLIVDSTGNLYGTTEGGGSRGDGEENVGGTAFKLAPNSAGGWTETIMHSFGGSGDGISPRANLLADSSGNFFGTTYLGGANSAGTVFTLAPKSGGGFTETIIHNFNPVFSSFPIDGSNPAAGLVLDSKGNLYGTTAVGGDGSLGTYAGGGGIVFKLSRSGGAWNETILYPFFHTFYGTSIVYSGLILDKSGNLYGTTLEGRFRGAVFRLTPTSSGYWNETDLYDFDGTHGSNPGVGSLVFDSSGNLYGATQNGGANKDGVVFKVTP